MENIAIALRTRTTFLILICIITSIQATQVAGQFVKDKPLLCSGGSYGKVGFGIMPNPTRLNRNNHSRPQRTATGGSGSDLALQLD